MTDTNDVYLKDTLDKREYTITRLRALGFSDTSINELVRSVDDIRAAHTTAREQAHAEYTETYWKARDKEAGKAPTKPFPWRMFLMSSAIAFFLLCSVIFWVVLMVRLIDLYGAAGIMAGMVPLALVVGLGITAEHHSESEKNKNDKPKNTA